MRSTADIIAGLFYRSRANFRRRSHDNLVCFGWLVAGLCYGLRLRVVQCSQHPDPGMEHEVAAFGGTDQAGDSGLPSFMVLLGLVRGDRIEIAHSIFFRVP